MLTSAGWHIVGCSRRLSARDNDYGSARGLRSFRRSGWLSGDGRAGLGEGRDSDSHGFFA